MRRSAHILCTFLLGLALPRCSMERTCEQSSQCDLQSGGLCVAGTCTYPADACGSGLAYSSLSGQSGCVDGPPLQTIVLDPETSFQTIDKVGASTFLYAIGEDEGYDWDPVSAQFEALDLDAVRMLSWFYWWEPENDDDDPFSQGGEPGFESSFPHITRDDVPFGQWGHEAGLQVMPSLTGFGEWMRPNGELDFQEYAESVVMYTRYLLETGTPIRIVDLIAPGEEQHPDTPADGVAMVEAVISYFNDLGHGEVFVAGPGRGSHDDHGPYIDALLDSWAAERVEAISYRHWGHPPVETLAGIRDRAQASGRPVWAIEIGSCSASETCGEGLDPAAAEWLDAADLFDSTLEAFVLADATRVYPAFVVPAMIDFDGAVRQNYWALAHISRYVEPGALRIAVSAPGDEEAFRMASFQDLDGTYRVLLHNSVRDARRLRFELEDGTLLPVVDAVRSCERESLDPAPLAGDSLVEVGQGCIVTVTLGEAPK